MTRRPALTEALTGESFDTSRAGLAKSPGSRIALAVVYPGLILIAVLVHLGQVEEWVLEGWLILAVLLPVVTHSAVTSLLARAGLIRLLFVTTLLLLMLVGNLFMAPNKSFPFVAWRMYGTIRNGDPVVYEYQAVLKSGRATGLVPSRLLPGMTSQRFSGELISRMEGFRRAPNERLAAMRERRARSLLTALGRVYNRSHPEDPTQTVLVFKTVIPLPTALAERKDPTTTLLWRVPVK